MCDAHIIRHLGCGLTDRLEVAQRGALDQTAGPERLLIQPIRVGNHLLGEGDHVVDVEASLAADRLRHELPHVR